MLLSVLGNGGGGSAFGGDSTMRMGSDGADEEVLGAAAVADVDECFGTGGNCPGVFVCMDADGCSRMIARYSVFNCLL